jgi:hypothetical protein
MDFVVQQNSRTPTGPYFESFCIRWHPWFGVQVAVHEAIEKADGVVFRCTLSGCDADRWLEVSVWVFERASYTVAIAIEVHEACRRKMLALRRRML